MTSARAWLLIAAVGCTGGPGRFPLRAPYSRDSDLDPVSVSCRPDPSKKEPTRVACMPETYLSPFVWNQIENTVFERISRGLAVDVIHEAANANSLDEVADSSWFEHQDPAATTDQKAKGACKPEDLLPAESTETWVINHGKDNGSTVGFRVDIPGKGEYLLKADEPEMPERASAASVIGAAFYHAAGFHTTCEQVVYFRRDQLKLTPGLITRANDGVAHPFDDAALNEALKTLPRRGDTIRMQASKWLTGAPLGPFRYEKTRDDDPNDIIRHEDRRELRGSKLLAAWLNHWDAREQNSMDVWIARDPKHKESSPGYVRHYIIDASDIFGQAVEPKALEQRVGYSYLIDVRDIAIDLVTLGLVERPWDRAEYVKGREIFGYYSARDFDPDRWKPGYPNPAFLRMTERDGAWMARIIARFSPADIHALVAEGQFTDPTNVDYLAKVVLDRQQIILKRYLSRLSPIADVHREADGKLCGVDLARLRGVFDRFQYRVVEEAGGKLLPLTAEVRDAGVVCFMPRSVAASGLPDDAAGRVAIFHVDNGTQAGELEIHTYDLGPTRGMQVVGLVRPEAD